jgi:hypothetical protein
MENEIKIIIGGDATQLTQAAKKANEALGPFTNLTNQTSSALRKVAKESDNAAESVKKISKVSKDIFPEGSIAEARATIKRLKDEIISLGPAARQSGLGKALVAELKLAEGELKVLETQAGLTAAKSGNVLSTLFGGLRTVANILPGVGIGGIIGFLAEPLIEGAKNMLGLGDATKKAAEEVAKFKASIKSVEQVQGEAIASEAGNIAQVQALADVVQNSNIPYAQRKRALEELKETNKAYFGDLTLENSLTGKLTKSVKDYTDALISSAVQKKFVDEIADLAKRSADSDDVIKKSRDKLNSADREHTQSQARLVELRKQLGEADAASVGKIRRAIDTELQKSSAAFFEARDAQKELSKANEEFTQLQNQELVTRNKLNQAVLEGTKFKKLETGGHQEDIDFLKKRLDALEKIQAATKDATTKVGLQEAIFELQVKIAIRDQGKNQLSKQELDQQIKGFQDELNAAFKNQAIELEAIPKVKFSEVLRADISAKEVESKIQKAIGFDKDIKIPAQYAIDLRFNGKEFADNAERVRQQVKEVSKALFDGIVSGIEQGSALLGEAIGGILSGSGVTNALASAAQGLLSIVGGILQQVGKEIIITSKLVAALKKAIKGLFGPGGEGVALAVGVALIATGSLLKNIKFDVPKLAQGGIATGPTLGIFGEAGKEAIIPLDKLPEMLGRLNVSNQSDVALAPTIRISLTDLELGLERVRSQRRRLG